jgi:hypothetical protein
MPFNDFEIEVSDNLSNKPYHINGTVTVAGTPIIVEYPEPNKKISNIFILNPSRGSDSNLINDLLYISLDEGVNYLTIARGESVSFPVNRHEVYIDASKNLTNFQIIVWG